MPVVHLIAVDTYDLRCDFMHFLYRHDNCHHYNGCFTSILVVFVLANNEITNIRLAYSVEFDGFRCIRRNPCLCQHQDVETLIGDSIVYDYCRLGNSGSHVQQTQVQPLGMVLTCRASVEFDSRSNGIRKWFDDATGDCAATWRVARDVLHSGIDQLEATTSVASWWPASLPSLMINCCGFNQPTTFTGRTEPCNVLDHTCWT